MSVQNMIGEILPNPGKKEDDGIIHGWRRCADGTWERVNLIEYDLDLAAEDLYPDIEAEEQEP